MALGTVRRLSFIPLGLALALAQGCFSTTSSDDDGGCTKDTDCASGRICEKRTCVANPILGSGGSGGTGGSSGSGGSSGASGMGGTGGAGGSGTGGSGTAMCTDADPILCPSADEMSLCINGTYQTLNCTTACTTLGFEVGPCEEPNGCGCGYPTNAACENAVNAYCACLEGTDTPCDNSGSDPLTDPLSLYVSCHLNDPPEDATFLLCVGDQVDSEGMIDCQAAADACIPE